MACGLNLFLLASRLKGSYLKTEKMVDTFMNEFLLVALVIVYLLITYVPISEAPKGDWQSRRDDRFSHGNAETDGGRW
jgi:hypothetical protein